MAGDGSRNLVSRRCLTNHFGWRVACIAWVGVANRGIRIEAGRGTADQRGAILETEVERGIRVSTITSWAAFHSGSKSNVPSPRSKVETRILAVPSAGSANQTLDIGYRTLDFGPRTIIRESLLRLKGR